MLGTRTSGAFPIATFRSAHRDLCIAACSSYSKGPVSLASVAWKNNRSFFSSFLHCPPQCNAAILRRSKSTFASSQPTRSAAQNLPRDKAFSDAEIKSIFGRSRVSHKQGNRILSVLHARRLEGTLDLDLPTDITRTVDQSHLDAALQWLRTNYPIDEDAAIMARIEREDNEAEQKLVRRAEQLGLYKPQSGSYEAELGEENSVYGKSVLKEAREQNEARLLDEKERKRREWLEGEHRERERLQNQVHGNTALKEYQEAALTEARPRADPDQRPYLAWIQKHHIAGTHNQPEAINITTSQRLIPPLLFAVVTLGLCYAFTLNYEPPAKEDRLWPTVPPAVATIGAIIGANVAVTFLWKFIPPSWRLLNRFFVIVPFYPSSFSMIGAVFSHQTWRHLTTNMMVLGLMGTKVHDELGRGNFLAVYFASGAIGSLMSLSRSVVLGALGMTSLGASAATSGIVAAWCMYHSDDKITVWLLPRELQDTVWTYGSLFLCGLIAVEVFGMVMPARLLRVFPFSRMAKMDQAAHLGGYLTGAGCGYVFAQRKRAEERERKAREKSQWFPGLGR
ncbi:hypothetical protein N7512_005311 [Penicillium capsulatum]|nr:hypothetical protein N7512_005311 [Penicillium capsulatum]